jgi:hypothetical protein
MRFEQEGTEATERREVWELGEDWGGARQGGGETPLGNEPPPESEMCYRPITGPMIGPGVGNETGFPQSDSSALFTMAFFS